MKYVALTLLLAASAGAQADFFKETKYTCYLAMTKTPVAQIVLTEYTGNAVISFKEGDVVATFTKEEGHCPSRLCGNVILDVDAAGVSTFLTGLESNLSGSISKDLDGDGVFEHISTYCELK